MLFIHVHSMIEFHSFQGISVEVAGAAVKDVHMLSCDRA